MPAVRDVAIRLTVQADEFRSTIGKIGADMAKIGQQGGRGMTTAFRQMEKAATDTSAKIQALSKRDAATASETSKAIVTSSKKATDAKVSDSKRVVAAVTAETKAVLTAELEVERARAKSGGKVTQAVREAEAKLADAKVSLYRKEQATWETIYAQRLSKVKAGSAEQLRLETELAQKQAAIQARVNTQSRTAMQKRAPIRTEGGDRKLERGENAMALSAGLQAGNIAGVAASFGPMGAAAGIVADQIFSAIGRVKELGEAALKESRSLDVLRQVLGDRGFAMSVGEFEKLRVEISALERPVGMTREEFVGLAQSAARYTDPPALKATLATMTDMSHVEPGANLKALGLTLNDVADSTGGFVQAADLASAVAQEMTADSVTPLTDAANGLGQALPEATAALGDQKRAAAEAAAVMTGLVKANIAPGEAAGMTAKAFKGLNEVLNDPATLKMVQSKMPAGFDITAAAMDNGQVSLTKFLTEVQKLGPEAQVVAAQLGDKLGGQALRLLTSSAQQGGESLGSLVAKFSDVEGASRRMSEVMITDSQREQEINKQRVADLELNAGKAVTGILEGGENMLGGLLDQFATFDFGALAGPTPFGPLAGGLNLIRDLLVDNRVEAERSFNTFADTTAATEGLRQVSAGLSSMAETEGVAAITDDLKAVEAQSPATAEAIRRIAQDVNLTEPEKLAAVNEQLGIMQSAQLGKVFVQLAEAIEQSEAAIDEAISKTESWATIVTDALVPSWLPLSETITDSVQALSGGDIASQLTSAREAAATLTEEYRAAKAAGEDTSDIATRLNEANQALFELEGAQAQARDTAVDQMTKQLDAKQKAAELAGQEFDRQEEINIMIEGATGSLQRQPDILNEVRSALEGGATAAGDLAAASTETVDAAEAQVAPVSGVTDLIAEQDALLTSKGIKLQDNNDAEIASLEATATATDQIVGQMEAQLSLYEAAIKAGGIQEEQVRAIAKAEEEVNKIIADRKAAEATGQVSVKASGSTGPTTKSSVAELEGLRDTLKGNIAHLKEQSAGYRESIKSLKSEGSARGKASDTATKSAGRLAKAQDEAALAGLEGRAKDEKAAQLARDRAIKEAGDDRDAVAAANQEYANDMASIAQKHGQKLAQDREKQAQKDEQARQKREAEAAKADEDRRNAQIAAIENERQREEAIRQAAAQEADTALGSLLSAMEAVSGAVSNTANAVNDKAAQIAAIRAGGNARNLSPFEIEAARGAASQRIERLQQALRGQGGASFAGATAAQREAQGQIGPLQAVSRAAPEVIRSILEIGDRLDQARQEADLLTGSLGDTLTTLRNMDPTNVQEVAKAIADANRQSAEASRLLADTVATNQAEVARQQAVLAGIREQAAQAERDAAAAETRAAELGAAYAAQRTVAAEDAFRSARAAASAARVTANDLAASIATNEAAMAPAMQALESQTRALQAMGSGGISDVLRDALLTLADTSDEWGAISSKVDTYRKAVADSGPVLDAHAQRTKDLADLDRRLAAARQRQADAAARGDTEAEDRFNDEADAVSALRTELLALPEDLRTAQQQAEDMAKGIGDAFSRIAGLIQGGVSFIEGMKGAKDAGDVTMAAADLTSLVGQTFMELGAGTPLALIGAFMVGGAQIAKAVVGLARLFEGQQETPTERADRERAAQERINAVFDARLSLAEALAAAGDNALDNAREQLRVQTEIANERLRELGIVEDIANLDRDAVEAEIKHGQEQEARFQGLLDKAKEASKGVDFTGAFGIQMHGVVDPTEWARKAGIEGVFASWEDLFAFLESETGKAQDYQERFNQALQDEATYHQNIRALMEEELSLLDLREKLGESQNAILAERERIQRRMLSTELDRIADADAATLEALRAAQVFRQTADGYVVDLSGKTADQIADLLRVLANMPESQLTGDITALATEWLDAAEAAGLYGGSLEDAAAASDDLFSAEHRRLELLHELGRLTDEDFQAQMEALLRGRIAEIDAQRLTLTTQADLLDNEIARLEIEAEIKSLMEGQTDAADEQDQVLADIVRRRQEMLELLRLQSQGGTLTADQQARLDTVTAEAVARLRETGASEEEVQAFLDSLPKYSEGGLTPAAPGRGTPIMVGEKGPEWVIPAEQTRALLDLVGQRSFFNSREARIVSDAATREAAGRQGGGQVVNITFGEIRIVMPPGVTMDQAKQLGGAAGSEIIQTVQRAFQSGQLSIDR